MLVLQRSNTCLRHPSILAVDNCMDNADRRLSLLLQPAIFALVCVIFKISFTEIPPPIHPKTQPELHVVLPIEDSCYMKPLADADGKTPNAVGKTPRTLLKAISADSRSIVNMGVISDPNPTLQRSLSQV